jgi:hypothetical protein
MDVPGIVRSVAASGLGGEQTSWPSAPLDRHAWDELIRVVRQQRLAGLLVHAIDHGDLPATVEQTGQARREHFDGICRVLMLEGGALEIIDHLSTAGVEARVLKGPAVAHLDYPDPALRLFVDVDLLVSSAQFDQAVDALTTAGHPRQHPQPRLGFDRRFSKGTSFVAHGRLEIDLHRTFVMGPFGLRVVLDDLWVSASTFTVADTDLQALDPEVRFLHACFHAALGNAVPRLVPQRDVAQMLLNRRLDMDRVEGLMSRWQAEAVVAKAVSQTWRTLRLTDTSPVATWALRYRPSARSRRDLALYSDPNGSYTRKSLGALRALPGVRDKAAFAFALAFPDRSYVEARYSSPRERWRKSLRQAAPSRRMR